MIVSFPLLKGKSTIFYDSVRFLLRFIRPVFMDTQIALNVLSGYVKTLIYS